MKSGLAAIRTFNQIAIGVPAAFIQVNAVQAVRMNVFLVVVVIFVQIAVFLHHQNVALLNACLLFSFLFK
jgi:hypothetical protein